MQIDNKRVVSINFTGEASIKGKQVEVLANYVFRTGNWDVTYGDRAELIGAAFGDCVEKDIEKAVIESIVQAGFRALAIAELERKVRDEV